jgi:hypothetical protein
MSNDGKYVLSCYYTGQAFLSTNYGVSFTDISNSIPSASRFQPAISATGKYMFVTCNPPAGGKYYYSTNYGATWAEDPSAGRMTAMSYSGKYMVKCPNVNSNNIQFSSNYGASYINVDTGSSLPYPFYAAISSTGQVIAAVAHNSSGVKISKNFGKTWSVVSTVDTPNFVEMSASGRYILAGGYLSTDFGDTFTQPSGTPTSTITGVSVSANGQYMIITNAGTGFYSVDYGKTWATRGTNGGNSTNGTCVAMTANASFVMHVTSTGIYKYASLTNTDISVNSAPTKSSIDNSLNNYYTKTAIDSSLNTYFYNKTTSDSTFLAKSTFDSSMSTYYSTRAATDFSINNVLGSYYTKQSTDSSINNVLLNYSQGINYQVTNAGAGAYVINSNSNADITLIRGLTYVFSVNASGHPFWIQTSDGGYNSSNIYNTGIINNGTQSGNIRWVVDNTTPNTLYYVCQYHSSMRGQIKIVDLSFAPFTYVNDSLTSYYSKTAIDSSLNDNFYNKTTSNSTFLAKSEFDSSMSSYYYSKSVIDGSINSLLSFYSTEEYVNSRFATLVENISTDKLDTLTEIATALQGDASFGFNLYQRINSADASINTIRNSYALASSLADTDSSINTIRNSLSSYALASSLTDIDSSINTIRDRLSSTDSSINTIRNSLSSYATTTSLSDYATTASLSSYATTSSLSDYATTSSLSSYALTSSLSDYATTSSLSSYALTSSLSDYATTASLSDYATTASLSSYALTSSLSDYATTASLSSYALTSSLSDYATTASLSDYATTASLSDYATTASLSDYATTASLSDYATTASLSDYATTASLSSYALTSSLSDYATTASLSSYATTSSLSDYATTASLSSYATTSSLSSYATTASLSSYLQRGSTSDVSLNGNVQLGGGSRSVGINKLPNVLYALDISGDLDVNGNSYFGTGTNFVGINRQTATVALDISGTTNMSGNLALTKASSVTMGSFDLSSVNMSVFNVSEKYATVALSTTPTLDYSTGGIFYMPGVNAALTTINIINVPTTLNRSISITLMLAQTGSSGTFCFTTGTLNINGVSITYLKPDATALAAPSGSPAKSLIINQFIIIWASSTPTVIAYLSSMGV